MQDLDQAELLALAYHILTQFKYQLLLTSRMENATDPAKLGRCSRR